MTREEAIKVIKRMIKTGIAYDDGYAFEPLAKDEEKACGMAIKALEVVAENTTEIKVGDEIVVEGVNGIVVREPYPIGLDKELYVLVWYGQHMSSTSLKNVALTGRHFPQIMEVLEQLQESEG